MNNLKNARLATGLTQRQVAEKLGIKEQQYQAYEYNKNEPKVKTAMKIAKIFNSTVEEIFQGYLYGKSNNQEKH
jgi:DNA-binding XRE family transcriptional regulator